MYVCMYVCIFFKYIQWHAPLIRLVILQAVYIWCLQKECMYVCMYVCIYVCIYVFRYVCFYLCMDYVFIYIYITYRKTDLIRFAWKNVVSVLVSFLVSG